MANRGFAFCRTFSALFFLFRLKNRDNQPPVSTYSVVKKEKTPPLNHYNIYIICWAIHRRCSHPSFALIMKFIIFEIRNFEIYYIIA